MSELSTKLEDHIDDPIKKCVVGLNLLGIPTAMSCCGFTYRGEKVPKKHLKKCYVYIDMKKIPYGRKGLLIDLAHQAGWNIGFQGENFCDFYAKSWDSWHPWEKEGNPHFHEVFALAITRLEQTLEKYREHFEKSVNIKDGNSIYKERLEVKHWQYEPTEDWVVTPETFDAL